MRKKQKIILVIVLYTAIAVCLCCYFIPKKVAEKKQAEIDSQQVVFQSEEMHYRVCWQIDAVNLARNDDKPFDLTVGQCKGESGLYLSSVTLYEPQELDDLLYFPNLDHLDLTGNSEIELELRAEHEQDSEIYLNKLAEILPKLPKLTDLSIGSDLTIKNLDFLSGCKNLQCLIFSDNTIQDISALSEYEKLKALCICANNVTDITPLLGLPNLKYIYIDSRNPVCDDEEQMRLLRETFPDAEIDIHSESEN